MATSFKLYLTDGTTKKTITESHPKLTATDTEFSAAGSALKKAYDLPLDTVTVQSETVVYAATA